METPKGFKVSEIFFINFNFLRGLFEMPEKQSFGCV